VFPIEFLRHRRHQWCSFHLVDLLELTIAAAAANKEDFLL
jgi:hypothetical protein